MKLKFYNLQNAISHLSILQTFIPYCSESINIELREKKFRKISDRVEELNLLLSLPQAGAFTLFQAFGL